MNPGLPSHVPVERQLQEGEADTREEAVGRLIAVPRQQIYGCCLCFSYFVSESGTSALMSQWRGSCKKEKATQGNSQPCLGRRL